MSKKSLLDIVQDILSDMNSDSVNSISDTVESMQVAAIVRTTYDEIITSRHWPQLQELIQLESSGDADKPTHMELLERIQYMEWIKYNKRTSTDTRDKYLDVTYLEPKEFLDKIMSRVSDASNIQSVTDYSGTTLLIRNDTAPTFWTTFDDHYIVFDSFDSDVDSILQKSKTQCEVYKEPVWSHTDTYVPDLPSKAFPYLIAEAKSTAFNAVKQAANAKEEQRSRRQRGFLAEDKFRMGKGIKWPDYGRR